MSKKLFILLFITLFSVGSVDATEKNIKKSRASVFSSLNVLTNDTDSIMGDSVARHFGQLLYIRKMSVRSGLVIKEKKISSNTNEISIETPLRVITTHRFLMTQPRTWISPVVVAEEFVTAALKGGLLKTKK